MGAGAIRRSFFVALLHFLTKTGMKMAKNVIFFLFLGLIFFQNQR